MKVKLEMTVEEALMLSNMLEDAIDLTDNCENSPDLDYAVCTRVKEIVSNELHQSAIRHNRNKNLMHRIQRIFTPKVLQHGH